MPQIHICLAADQQFGKYLYFTIASILINRAVDDILHFHILSNNIDQCDKDRLLQLTEHYDLQGSLEFIEFDYNRFSYLISLNPRFPLTVCARLLIPETLIHLPKVLYLDCDVIVRSSLSQLWETDMHGNPIAGVLDKPDPAMTIYLQTQDLNPKHYINSGVLIFDCNLWRHGNLTTQMLNIGKDRALQYPDQDLINILLKDKFTILDKRWNSLIGIDRNAKDNIIHYAGPKPWETVFVFGAEYFWDIAMQLPETTNLISGLKDELKESYLIKWYITFFKCKFFNAIGFRQKHYTQKISLYRAARNNMKYLKPYFTPSK